MLDERSCESPVSTHTIRDILFRLARTIIIIVNLLVAILAFLFIYVSFNAFDSQDYELDSAISFGSNAQPSSSSIQTQPKLIHTYVSLVCAGLGLAVSLLTLLGLYGGIRRSKSVLITYSLLVFLVVSLLFLLVVYTYSMNHHQTQNSAAFKDVDKVFVNSTVVVYNHVDPSDTKTRIIDYLQRTFSCCGVNSPNDWAEYSLHRIPRSCCSYPIESSLPVFKYCAESDHKIGCWRALNDHFYANLSTFRNILYTLMVFGLICIAMACTMIIALRRNLDVV